MNTPWCPFNLFFLKLNKWSPDTVWLGYMSLLHGPIVGTGRSTDWVGRAFNVSHFDTSIPVIF